MTKACLLFLCFLTFTGSLFAQQENEEPKPHYYWIQISAGTGNSDLSGEYSLNADLGDYYFGLGYSGFLNNVFEFFAPPSEELQVISLKAGKFYRHNHFYFGLNGGLGYAKLTDPRLVDEIGIWYSYGVYENEYHHLANLSFQFVGGIKILQISTLNLAVGGELNPRSSQVYVRLGLGFGKFF